MIVGLYGDSRAGKDTVARIMVEEFGAEWRSFAAPLRQILLNVNPYLRNEPGTHPTYLADEVEQHGWDWVKKNYPESVDWMIQLGQSVRDLIHVDAWIWSVLTDPLPRFMVISDVRQPNEYDAIRHAGGEVWRVIRPGTTRRGMDGLLDDRYFPVTLHNNTNRDDLRMVTFREVNRAIQDRWDGSGPYYRFSSIYGE